jgi:hypothetical protein
MRKKLKDLRGVLICSVVVLTLLLAGLCASFFARRDHGPTFARIEIGMSHRDVREAFGCPAGEHTDFGSPGLRYPGGEVRFRETWYSGRAAFGVYFGHDGTVVGKEEHVYPSPLQQLTLWVRRQLHF